MSEDTAQHAIVAGASGDIGSAICQQLMARDYRVTGLGRSDVSAGEASFAGDDFRMVLIDFADLDNLSTGLENLLREQGSPDALILTAGYGHFGSIEQFSSAQIRTMIDVNLTSQLLLLKCFVPAMKRQRRGRIVVIGSESALQGRRYGSVYSAAKFAMRGALQALREECAGKNVQLTIINPGMVRTKFFDDLDFEPAEGPLHALDAADVAKAVSFALSARDGACVDEINLSPVKKVVRQKSTKS